MKTPVQTYLIGDTYPPEDHILRDLAVEVKTIEAGKSVIQAPVNSHICAQNGLLYAGVLATLVDVVGGILAVQAIAPDWLSTANMSLMTIRDIRSGIVSGKGRIIRCGRTAVVVEVDIYNEDKHPVEKPQSVGLAMITYSRLPGNKRELRFGSRTSRNKHQAEHFSLGRLPLDQPFVDKVGIHIVDSARGRLRTNNTTYVRNSLDSLQGGVIALLAELAGQLTISTIRGKSWQTRDLTIHYMTPGIKGPFETTTKILRSDDNSALIKVGVTDRGDGHRLMAIIFLVVQTI